MRKNIFFFNVIIFFFLIACSNQNKVNEEIPITTNSEEALELFKKGRELTEKFFVEESASYFSEAIKKDSSFALAYLNAAYTSSDQNIFLKYFDKAKTLIDQVSEGEKLLILAYESMYLTRNNVNAEELLLKLLSLYPNDKRASRELGLNYYYTQSYDEAIKYLKRSIELDSNFADPYNMLGYSYANLGYYDKAERALKKYAELLPMSANPHDSYAEILMKQGKFDESMIEYEKALSNDPNFLISHIGIGTNLIFKGQYEEGRKHFQTAYDLSTDDWNKRTALQHMANSYIYEGKYEKAIAELEKSYESSKKSENSLESSWDLSNLADLLLEMGRIDEASEKYQMSYEVIQKSDDLPDERKKRAKQGLLLANSMIALKRNDISLAQTTADEYLKVIELQNDSIEVKAYHAVKGMIAFQLEEYDSALKEFLQSNLRNPKNLYRIAETYEKLNEREKALEYYSEVANFNEMITSYAFTRNKSIKKLNE